MKLFSPRFRAALRYLGFAPPPWTWRISCSICPSCGGKYFISMGRDAFMTRCLSCRANVTNLSLIPVIQMHSSVHEIQSCWEMSTYGATLDYLESSFDLVYKTEYYQGALPGEIIKGIRNEDVQNTSFPDASLDLITSNQVFEHVPDDIKGFGECYRVLKRGGALIFTVPLYSFPKTERLAEILEDKLVVYGEPEYHDSRTDGPNTALTFWHHSSLDICERVSKVGFDAKLMTITIPPSQRIPIQVIYAVKV
jgi:hypothetical protein